MKFINDGNGLTIERPDEAPYAVANGPMEILFDKMGDGAGFVMRKFVEGLQTGAGGIGDWIIAMLPDLMGYITMVAGVFIILNAMIGRGGMMKTLGWYSGAFILVLCILTGAQGGS